MVRSDGKSTPANIHAPNGFDDVVRDVINAAHANLTPPAQPAANKTADGPPQPSLVPLVVLGVLALLLLWLAVGKYVVGRRKNKAA